MTEELCHKRVINVKRGLKNASCAQQMPLKQEFKEIECNTESET